MNPDLLELFRAEGIRVRVDRLWRTHVRPGVFRPEGVMVHHTGDKGTGDSGLSVLRHGRPDLNGPLCNGSPRDDATLVLMSAGRANHAGAGSSRVLADVRAERAPSGTAAQRGLKDDTVGNGFFYGWEVDNDGLGQPYPPGQYDTTVRACTAVCRAHGWSANRVILHEEWTSRKNDWSLPAAALRAAVAHRLAHAVQVNGIWTLTDGKDWLDMATKDEVRELIREALNEGTGAGQQDWPGTSRAVLGTVQGLVNQVTVLTAQVKALSARATGGTVDIDAVAKATVAELKEQLG